MIPLLLIVFSGASPTFYGGQIAEAPAMWLDVIGLSCFWLALESDRAWLALISGVCYVLMVSFRIPSAINLIALLPLVWASPAPRLKTCLQISTAVAGALLVAGALYAHGQIYGYWDEFLVVFHRNLSYGSLDRVPLSVSLFESARTLARIHLANTLVGLLLAVSAVVLFPLRSRLRPRERTWVAIAALWLLAALASAYPGGRHYAHYYHLAWPAITLLSTLWLAPYSRLLRASPRIDGRLTCGIAAGALAMCLLGELYSGAKAARDLRQGTHAWNALDEAVKFLDRHTTRETPVLVHVWLDWAELYLRAPRPAPSLSIPHVVPRDRYREWLDETSRALPEWILTDGTPWEPIDGPLTDADAIAARDHFAARIDRDYYQVQRTGNLRILRRKGAP